VKVNNQRGQLNTVVTENNEVTVDNRSVKLQQNRYILLYKPAGYVTTLKDEKGRRKVSDLVKITERVVPVGRLDYDTTGALLLTNDGDLAHKLMHPSFEIDKVYEAEVAGSINKKLPNMLSNSVQLEDGPTAPARARQLAKNKIELTIHEGRKHQVKRMLAAVGLKVIKLHRSQFGPLTLAGLTPGQWRDLSKEEIAKLKG